MGAFHFVWNTRQTFECAETAEIAVKSNGTHPIEIELPDGVPHKFVRDVTENCRALRFQTHGFEEE